MIVPHLSEPPPRGPYEFSLGSLQRSSTRRVKKFSEVYVPNLCNRLYLAAQPIYGPFLIRMWSLATWTARRRSAAYCSLFWILWFYDLLLPALTARLLYGLLERRILPYPTAADLRERRYAAAKADVMGAEIRQFLDAHYTLKLGVKDAWRVFKIVNKGRKEKAKEMDEIQTNTEEELEFEDNKRVILTILEELANIHERLAKCVCR